MYEFHEMLLWETHMSFSAMIHVVLDMSRIVRMRTVFLFSEEALLWKIIMCFWKGKKLINTTVWNAHVLLWIEKPLFGICQSIVKSSNSLPFLCRSFNLKDNHVLLKVYEFLLLWETNMCYTENRSHFLWNVPELLEWELCSRSL